jgi:hypothetical protein
VKGDFTRFLFDPLKRYVGVLVQQVRLTPGRCSASPPPPGRRAGMSGGRLFGRGEEVDRLEGEKLTVSVIELWRVLDPEFDKTTKVDQCQLPLLLGASLPLCISREATGRDEDADIVATECPDEGTDPVAPDLRVGLPLDLNLDPRTAGSEGIVMSNQVDTTVGAWRCNPQHVVAHRFE